MLVFVLGAAPGVASAPRDPSKDARRALLRSAVCPGWGQLTAGSTVKGIVFMAASAGMLYAHLRSDDLGSGRRRELNRWTVLFWLYNLGDAYVDGYLSSFDAEMQEVEDIGQGLVRDGIHSSPLGIGVSLRW